MPETLSSDILKREAFYLADLIIYRYTSENGGLFEKVDIKDGKAVGFECAVDELGDYIQYIAYLGILTSKKEYVDWSLNTATLIAQNYQSEKGLFYNRLGGNFIRKNLLSLNNADTITGLVSAYIFTNSDLLRPIIIKFIEGAFRSFTKDHYLTYGYILDNRISVSLSSLLFSAYFIEEVLYFMEHEADGENFVKIKEVIDANLSNRYFLRHGIFQARIPLGLAGWCWQMFYRFIKRDNLNKTFFVKDNIYFLFALLKYYTIVKDEGIKDIITQTYERLLELFSKDGRIYNSWLPVKGCIDGPSGLSLSHSIIELQLDLHHEFNVNKYLQQAVEITDMWLNRQSSLGVMNETLFDSGHYSILDSNVDFAINLVKLSEKTGHGEYLEKAFEVGASIIEYFKAPFGFYWKINTNGGFPLHREIETKYLGLLLKLFLILMEVIDNKLIFENALLRNLARDR